MIPLDEQVLICAKHKKSLVEREIYEKDGDELFVDTLWRNGEFAITCHALSEARLLEDHFKTTDHNMELCLNDHFDEWEMHGTFDGCSMDFYGDGSEEIEQAQEEGDDDWYYHTWLEENGWEQVDTKYYIYGGVEYA